MAKRKGGGGPPVVRILQPCVVAQASHPGGGQCPAHRGERSGCGVFGAVCFMLWMLFLRCCPCRWVRRAGFHGLCVVHGTCASQTPTLA